MKILNLYCGIGGNRQLWGNSHEITAIENDIEIAKIYKDLYPNDNVIVTDAHDYLLNNFYNFDFIWSSIPCTSHSRLRFLCTKNKFGNGRDRNIIYPDLKLYEEIIFLQKYANNILWVVENVIPYYTPLISAKVMGRHLIWSNFFIQNFIEDKKAKIRDDIKTHQLAKNIDLKKYKIKQRKDKILRNCVDGKLGLHILNNALLIENKKNINQIKLNLI